MNLQDMFDESDERKFFRHSEETKNKLSSRVWSQEHRNNLSKARKGRTFSKETLAKISDSQKARTLREKQTLALRKSAWPLQTPDGVFPSALEYSKFVGVARITIYKRIERCPDQYYFIKKECQK